jgi:hypothetical protein
LDARSTHASLSTRKKKNNPAEEPLWNQEPHIFAIEKSQRKCKYLEGHFGRIADWYWHEATPKHLYEVICESTPCTLSFDLEYSKLYNPDIDPTHLLEDF